MKIKKAELSASAVKKSQYPLDRLNEIVLVGRSNVGKSSLINSLINRKALARTSSAPGKTRLLNFYYVDAEGEQGPLDWHFVDLPGYGYAKVAKKERENWLSMIEEYLTEHGENKFIWQLVDIRHAPSNEDIIMSGILRESGFAIKVIVTKADKISRGARQKNLTVIARDLKVNPSDMVVFSAITKEGREELWRLIEEYFYVGEMEI